MEGGKGEPARGVAEEEEEGQGEGRVEDGPRDEAADWVGGDAWVGGWLARRVWIGGRGECYPRGG